MRDVDVHEALTCGVIDGRGDGWLPEVMTNHRFDRTLRSVMWLDAFLSAAVAVLCAVASPVVAAVGVPQRIVLALGIAAIGCAVLLAACGAVTGVLIMQRMRAGHYQLPGLRLPLPAAMRPPIGPEDAAG